MFRWFICISIMIYKEVMTHLGSRQNRWRPSWIFENSGHFHQADHGRFFTLVRRPYFQAKTVEKLNKAILLRLNHLFTGLHPEGNLCRPERLGVRGHCPGVLWSPLVPFLTPDLQISLSVCALLAMFSSRS